MGIMLWAGITATGKTRLVFVERGVKINAAYYLKHIIREVLGLEITLEIAHGRCNKTGLFHIRLNQQSNFAKGCFLMYRIRRFGPQNHVI